MYKAALALLVGLMLSVSGSAWAATTFKDGKISSEISEKQWRVNYLSEVEIDEFTDFRTISYKINDISWLSQAAFVEEKTFFGWVARGILFFENDLCRFKSRITNSKTKTGSLKVTCSTGLVISGSYTVRSASLGGFGTGKDTNNRRIEFVWNGRGSSAKDAIKALVEEWVEHDTPELVSIDFESYSDRTICYLSTHKTLKGKKWQTTNRSKKFVEEARRRGLGCGVKEGELAHVASTHDMVAPNSDKNNNLVQASDTQICEFAVHRAGAKSHWVTSIEKQIYVVEAQKRGLNCGVNENQIPTFTALDIQKYNVKTTKELVICKSATRRKTPLKHSSPLVWEISNDKLKHVLKAQSLGLNCGVEVPDSAQADFINEAFVALVAALSDGKLCDVISGSDNPKHYITHKIEAKSRGLSCSVNKSDSLQISADLTTNNPDYVRALAAAKRGNDNVALKMFTTLANLGHPKAQFNLGVMYDNGFGVPKNYDAAFRWYSLAADSGVPEAYLNLGIFYQFGYGVAQNYERAFSYYVEAEKSGLNEAKFQLGKLYQNGFGVEKDTKEAIRWYLLAAEEGNRLAQYNLGMIYYNGLGVPKNFKEALRWYEMSANQGTAEAQFSIAVMYENGLGVAENNNEAFKWYELAANQGLIDAQFNLAVMYEYGDGTLRDMVRAFKWYKLASQKGDDEAAEIVKLISKEMSPSDLKLANEYVTEFEISKPSLSKTLLSRYGFPAAGVKNEKVLTQSNNSLIASSSSSAPVSSSSELEAANEKALQLEQELAVLKAQQEEQQQTISGDTQAPLITITSQSSNGPQGTISGRVADNTGVGEVRVDGQLVVVGSDGSFTANTYVPEGGVSVVVEAFDLAGLSSSVSVQLDRVVTHTASFSFERLNPLRGRVAANPEALALIIGVSDYKETNATAVYADSDAKVFADYAVEKLGVPRSRIKTLVNDGADEKDVLLAVKRWLVRGASSGKTDVYVFFAGHGLASDDGEQMYLLPYDGAPELLDDTAIARERLFSDIASANPRSVTVFLDTCYSGTTRGTDMLIASRPIAIKALKQSVPDNFTVMTAAAGDQTAKPLEEAKHGMFSYFLMKGMEGEADANQDNKITAGELHSYVQTNVIQQSSGSQTPELQGDADRVLVQFQ